jgi:hypothetical protein
MKKINNDLTINETTFELNKNKKGKIAVFMYSGDSDPVKILDDAVRLYVGEVGYHELIDYNLENPWMRVVLSDINEIDQQIFNPNKHKLKKFN